MTDQIKVPVELAELMSAQPPAGAAVVEEWYGVFNDPEFIQKAVEAGMPEELADKLREPLHQTQVAGAAKRYMLWTNETRDEHDLAKSNGYAHIRKQTVTTTPWEVVTQEELNTIDEGRRAYG